MAGNGQPGPPRATPRRHRINDRTLILQHPCQEIIMNISLTSRQRAQARTGASCGSAPLSLLVLLCTSILMPASAIAQSQSAASASRYQVERANCFNGKSNQDSATCLREANAALAATKQGKLADSDAPYQKNAALRCQALQAGERDACERRMRGEGTVSGSVESGGVLRELVVQAPDKPADTAK
jgi:hypothetical protein